MRAARARHRQRDDDQRETADREVDEEDPAPARVVDDEAADRRPDDRRRSEDRADQALPAAAVARRHDVADHGQREREEPAGADSLNRAEDDQLRHRRREAAERRADQEDDDREEEEVLAAVRVAELAVQRHGHRRGEHVGGEHPRVLRDAAEVADDPRERSRDDRLVERCQQQRHHQPGVDREDPADRELVAGGLMSEALANLHPKRLTRLISLRPGSLPPGAVEDDPAGDRDGADDLPAVQVLAQDQEREENGEERLHVREQRRARRADAVDRGEPEDVRQEQRPDDREREPEPGRPAEVKPLVGCLDGARRPRSAPSRSRARRR